MAAFEKLASGAGALARERFTFKTRAESITTNQALGGCAEAPETLVQETGPLLSGGLKRFGGV